MKQQYERYTSEHQQVWSLLCDRQIANLKDKASQVYLENLDQLSNVLHRDAIIRFEELNAMLLKYTGWQIQVVPGLIPAEDFLSFLADRKFCSSTWLRSLAQLDYLEEPDMFHDIFGHIPLLMDKAYADFMQGLGDLGRRYAGNEQAVAMLERFYWFTIEFGLINEANQTRIYGAGILSSFGESKSIYEPGAVIRSFDLGQILDHGFVKNDLQNEYFEICSFAQLYDSLDEVSQILHHKCSKSHLRQSVLTA